jgi:hypothetical protein
MTQNQPNQHEFIPNKEIDIKFLRLLPPLLNPDSLPLSGMYNDIDNIEEDAENILQNKFFNFDILELFPNVQNLFTINQVFGRVFQKEKLEGILMFTNIGKKETILLKSLEVYLINDEKTESRAKRQQKTLDIKLPNDGVYIAPSEVYSVKFVSQLDYVTKYTISINLKTRCSSYDYQFYTLKQRYNIKDVGKDYSVTDGIVDVSITRNLTFEVNYPFKVIEKFHNYQMNTCFIEIKIINNTFYPLTLTDLFLSPKSKPDFKIPQIDSLQELSKNQVQYLFEPSDDNNNSEGEAELNLSPSEYLTLQPEEETSILFKLTDQSLFFEEDKYVLNIRWLNVFDAIEKKYVYEFSNTLNTYNDFYKISVAQKPEKNIIKNENFKIILKLETKNRKKKYFITLSQEALRDNDKSNDREIEIIDIIEKKIELNEKMPENHFVLICKSDVLGNVYLPRLKFLLYEEKNTNPNGNVYDALLTFNCVQKK